MEERITEFVQSFHILYKKFTEDLSRDRTEDLIDEITARIYMRRQRDIHPSVMKFVTENEKIILPHIYNFYHLDAEAKKHHLNLTYKDYFMFDDGGFYLCFMCYEHAFAENFPWIAIIKEKFPSFYKTYNGREYLYVHSEV
jgi:hypothetical protein